MNRSYRSNFQRGMPLYNCIVCKRRTRGDGDCNSCELCAECFELAGWDNHHNDNGSKPDAEEMATFNALLKKIVKLGGDGDRVKSLNDYLWTEG